MKLLLKTNFKVSKSSTQDLTDNNNNLNDSKKDLTELEFEEFVSKSGAAGSFMIFRSTKKDDEMGLDEL